MATRVEERPVQQAAARPKRQRDEELLVWPDLVFIEFISAVLFTITLSILSAAISGPLLDKANPDSTPNPAKAPWYFLNLQELLLHMHPALAGVVVPTIALILLAALPYYDRSNQGQGVWFGGSPNTRKITWFMAVVSSVICVLLILYDDGRHVVFYDDLHKAITGNDCTNAAGAVATCWPEELNFLANLRGLQTGIDWPAWASEIPYLPFSITLRGQEFQNLDLPAFIVEQFIPVATMIGLPIVLLLVIRRWLGTMDRRDGMVAVFTGFMAVFVVLTIIGTAFRGQGLALVMPWDVPTHPH